MIQQVHAPERTVDPMVAFRLMCQLGNWDKVSEAMGYHPRSLQKRCRDLAAKGEYALTFARDAGRHEYRMTKLRRLMA